MVQMVRCPGGLIGLDVLGRRTMKRFVVRPGARFSMQSNPQRSRCRIVATQLAEPTGDDGSLVPGRCDAGTQGRPIGASPSDPDTISNLPEHRVAAAIGFPHACSLGAVRRPAESPDNRMLPSPVSTVRRR